MVTAVLLLAWVASGFVFPSMITMRAHEVMWVGYVHGVLAITYHADDRSAGISAGTPADPRSWGGDVEVTNWRLDWGLGSRYHFLGISTENGGAGSSLPQGWQGVGIAGWWPVILFGVPTFFLFRAERRARRLAPSNPCPSCGYSLAGLPPEGKCPECGKGR